MQRVEAQGESRQRIRQYLKPSQALEPAPPLPPLTDPCGSRGCETLPQTGINTTMIASIMMGLFGDRPGLCNGASGAIAVVVVDLVRTHPHLLMHFPPS
jgi:hypothetical protein